MTDQQHHTRRPRVSATTRTRAKELRKQGPIPEQLLWLRLRARQVGGVRFRRQHPIEPYILNFYCPQAKLAIELDGCSRDERVHCDEERTRYLTELGIRVVRFSDDEVLNNLDDVVRRIAYEIGLDP